MIWKPEPQPNAAVDERTKMEWLVRSFRKLSSWSSTRVNAGYGGLYLSAPTTLSPPIVLTTTWQKIVGFDSLITDSPIGMQCDLPNNRVRITEKGIWESSFHAAGEITPFTVNSPQTIESAIYNETTGAVHLISYHPVPRYSDVFEISLTGQREAPGPIVGLNEWMSLWVRARYASPAITITTAEDLEISLFRVSA